MKIDKLIYMQKHMLYHNCLHRLRYNYYDIQTCKLLGKKKHREMHPDYLLLNSMHLMKHHMLTFQSRLRLNYSFYNWHK
ncbi:Protein of unknown function [Lactobacillus helveticus CIRM-BIA 101]|uniref:Uncharacterized protein n=2 Tax=Lactobacillus helveticus TaxID=1587 RepID=U4QMG1_LACHE|nr:Protein of unknown function [Lactobacillus helveticus CIRM-BIA 953]CDI59061.1 Protein of unknown function [Lactobacillus helveticus CIRM-BIA 951]CDI64476.1 Protein of unknown function [Lactobacillus helveticus CIRM-BIA 101]